MYLVRTSDNLFDQLLTPSNEHRETEKQRDRETDMRERNRETEKQRDGYEREERMGE